MIKLKDKQRGSVVVFFALSLPVLLGVTGLAVDVGHAYFEKSRLQHIADSTALAGGKSISDKSKIKLLPVDKYDSLDKSEFEETSLETNENVKKFLVDKNANVSKIVEVTKSNSDEKTQYCYVELTKHVDAYFARVVGYDKGFPITVKSFAEVIPKFEPVTEEEKEEVIKEVNYNIHKTIPDYYSESIEKMTGKLDKFNPDFHLRALRRVETNAPKWDSSYYYKQKVNGKTYYIYNSNPDKTSAAYRDPNRPGDPQEDKDNNFAQSFLEANTSELQYSYCTFLDNYNGTPIDYPNITGAFLDIPNIQNSKTYRGLVFDIGNNADQKLGDKKEPFYIRVESEPIRVLQGDQYLDTTTWWNGGRTLVAPKIINVNESTRRPLVIAYDGPDQNRNADDAPILNEYDPVTGTIQQITTAITSTAMFRIYLNKDFKGVLYAPRSHVHIYGTGKIDGLILARKITLHGNQSSTRKVTTTESTVDIPVWILDRETNADGSDKGYHDNNFLYGAVKNGKYRKETLTSKFMIAYDDFCNYTVEEVEADED